MQRVEGYHNGKEDTALYLGTFNAMRDKDAYSKEDVTVLMDAYLRDWGDMWRHGIIPVSTTQEGFELRDNLHRKIEDAADLVAKVKGMSIGRLGRQDLEVIGELFESVSNVSYQRNGRRRRVASTAAGKLLHMLAWRSCIIWDDKVVRKGGKCYRDDKTGYVQYLLDKQAELGTILSERSISEIEKQHAKFLQRKGFKDAYEPITKMLDEINYY
jgi:hypothetical protein